MKKHTRLFTLLIAAAMCAGALVGCTGGNESTQNGSSAATSGETAGTPDTSKEVNLIYYLYGSEGVANPDILAKINEKLKADINATIEVKYIDWGDVATKYPLLFVSGEAWDMAHGGANGNPTYSSLVSDDALADITDLIPTATPALKEAIPEDVWATAKVNDRIYGVPSTYTEFTPYGFVYRRDLQEKYGVEPVTSLETMEAYLEAAKADGEFVPMNFGSADAINLYRMFVSLTDSWIYAPGIPESSPYLVATSAENYTDIIHPAFTDEFAEFVTMTREWADKGYWTKDVMAATQSAKDNTTNGLSAGYITHQPDWTGNYGAFNEKQPGVETDYWCFSEDKILRKLGVENVTLINEASTDPARALMAIEKFMTDESYYRLIQNGIEGRQYEIVDNTIRQPESYDPEKDAGGFAVWSLRTDEFNIPLATEDPRRYTLNEEWKEIAINNPFIGFSFDTSNVSTELASIANVDANLGVQLLFGKTQDDPMTALEQYRSQLQQAGVDKVIEEVKTQLADFTPIV